VFENSDIFARSQNENDIINNANMAAVRTSNIETTVSQGNEIVFGNLFLDACVI